MNPIETYKKELQDKIIQVEALRPLLILCQKAVTATNNDYPILIKDQKGNPHINVICLLDNLKEVVPLIRELAKLGIRSEKRYEDKEFIGDMAIRKYLVHPEITVMCFLSGKQCRRVQIGVQQVPIYETRCDDSDISLPTPTPTLDRN